MIVAGVVMAGMTVAATAGAVWLGAIALVHHPLRRLKYIPYGGI
jgi:hypothetical protein